MNLPQVLRRLHLVGLALLVPLATGRAGESEKDLAGQLRGLDATVMTRDKARAAESSTMLWQDARARLRAAALRENQAWHKVQTRADWEAFRDARLRALRASLGQFPPAPGDVKVRVTRKLSGQGYRIENLVFESRPGLLVTANLYLPADPPRSVPGVVIVPSHHNPKTQGELQDMGRTWARQGCAVLVPDMLGHGERRQHPFADAGSYPGPFKVGRQDYYFRYNTGVQLQLVGESLMGWMAWDLMRGLDVLLTVPGIDRDRILLIGSVAGGGDPAAVTAALDPRVTAVAPFNFGGSQPDYAIPANAERDFYYFGVPSWESTRSLRLGARDGFAQWVIVAAAAPRALLLCHEFAWDRDRDPTWPRLQKVFALYGAADRLAEMHGKGSVRGSPPTSTHCNNVGPYHRGQMYPALRRLLNFPVPEKELVGQRLPAADLACLTPDVVKGLRPRHVHELAADLGEKQVAAARRRLAGLRPEERRQRLRQDWARLLGDLEPRGDPKVTVQVKQRLRQVTAERLLLEPEPGILVPVVLLLPPPQAGSRPPVVVAVSQEGKQAFLKERAEAVSALLAGGAAVCLPDLRGTGETRLAGGRRYNSSATSHSAAELLLGQTLLGSRLRDLRSLLRYLRTRPDLDAARLALWGDSFASVNPPERRLDVPPDVARQPDQAEPLGGLLALLGALFEDDVRVVYARGGLAAYQSLLESPFLNVPHDALVPGVLTSGDLADVAAALPPRPLRLAGPVDGLNRRLSAEALAKAYAPARAAYRSAGAEARLLLETTADDLAARWLLAQLLAK
jgi:cephalosporin-C deacetylase-like acetyl esterase